MGAGEQRGRSGALCGRCGAQRWVSRSCGCRAGAPAAVLPHGVPSGIPNGSGSRSAGCLDSQHAPCGRGLRGGCREPGRRPRSVGGEWVGPLTRLWLAEGVSSALEKRRFFFFFFGCLGGPCPRNKRPPYGRAAGRVRLVLLGIPSALCGGALCSPWCSKAASSQISLPPKQKQTRKHTSL